MASGNETANTALFKDFDVSLKESHLYPLQANCVDTLQVNVGRLCNQSCVHCHVEAGPDRTEIMTRGNMQKCLDIVRDKRIEKVELTGGAPELNPHFRWFVSECRAVGCHVVVRSNLTAMLEPGCEDIPQFLKEQGVEIIASLPCYTLENVDAQRGGGVFDRSIEVLKILNEEGYTGDGEALMLNLVYNPGGASLPGDQKALEHDYAEQLFDRYQIRFNNLYAITNMPIGRFRKVLDARNVYASYMDLLINAFNPDAARNVMCRQLVSIGWDGSIYDCDFNQMLDMMVDHGAPTHVRDFDFALIEKRRIVTGLHCYGCTAGAGSSCTGALDQ